MYRACDANLGRWLNEDPTGLEAGINLYAYVDNDPIAELDLFGLDKYVECKKSEWAVCFGRCLPWGVKRCAVMSYSRLTA
jgi:hypothetical protein